MCISSLTEKDAAMNTSLTVLEELGSAHCWIQALGVACRTLTLHGMILFPWLRTLLSSAPVACSINLHCMVPLQVSYILLPHSSCLPPEYFNPCSFPSNSMSKARLPLQMQGMVSFVC